MAMQHRASTWWRDRADRQSLLAVLWFALNLESGALPTIALPLGILRVALSDHTLALGRVAALGSAVALVVPPLAGYASDRLREHGGQRMPLVVAGTAVNVAGLVAMAGAAGLARLAGGYLLATFGQNVTTAAYEALVPDTVPAERWGSASGYMGVFALLGTVAGLVAAGVGGLARAYAAMLGALVLGTLVTAAGVRESPAALAWPASPDAAPPRRRPRHARRFGARHGRRAFAWVFAARLAIMFGLSLLMTFILYYLRDVLGVAQPQQGTAGVAAMALIGAALSTFWAGRLSDRTDRTLVVFGAGLPMAAAALGFALLPSLSDILLMAVVFGVGYGVYLSSDWALALDTLPEVDRAGRDLGVWSIATNLPAVVAPVAGSWLISRYGAPAVGYRILFALSGASFLAGSVIVLRAGRRRPLAAVGRLALRLGVALGLIAYVRLRYRLRVEGRLPRQRRSLLLVANHLHDMDGMVLPPLLYLSGNLAEAPVSAGSRRMFEPGFLADRLGGPFAVPLRRLRLGPVLAALGVTPIEDMPRRRPLASLVDEGALAPTAPLAALLDDVALAALSERHGRNVGDLPLAAVLGSRRRDLGAERISLAHLREPARSRVAARLHLHLAAEVARLERLLARGRTVYLTPEGRLSPDGGLGRFRLALDRLLARARAVHLAALAYDSFAPGRLTLHLRLVPCAPGRDLRQALAAERVVTSSQVTARLLLAMAPGTDVATLMRAAPAVVAALGPCAHVAPDLARDATRAVGRCLRAMARRRQIAIAPDASVVVREPVRDRRFPFVADMLRYQARMLAETEAALRTEAAAGAVGEAPDGPAIYHTPATIGR
jgi:MFS family permease